MAGWRKPGPLGMDVERRDLNDGTSVRARTPPPGTVTEDGDEARNRVPIAARVVHATPALPVLRVGSRGEDVHKLQRLLIARSVPPPPLRLDGLFGERTRAAVDGAREARRPGVDARREIRGGAAAHWAQAARRHPP